MRSGKWWPWAMAWTLAAITVAVLVMAGVRAGAPERPLSAAEIRGWAVAVVTLGAFVLAAFRWAAGKIGNPPTRMPGERIGKAKDLLKVAVNEQWTREARFRGWERLPLIQVRWRAPVDSLVPSHSHIVRNPPRAASSAEIAELAECFRSSEPRRLVILGGPGTGKTTLAVELLLQLLATREGKEDEPVPVALPVTRWDTDRHPTLQAWLSEQLYHDYPSLRWLGVTGIRQMVDLGNVLPVLDGLDELPEPAQATVIEQLNKSLGARDQLILTSRTAEYKRAVGESESGRGLEASAVLEPLPVTPVAAARYLKRSLQSHQENQPAWARTLEVLRTAPGSALAGVAATPLGLWLLRTVYITGDGDPTELADPARFPTPEKLRAHLFDHLIAAFLPPDGGRDQAKSLGLNRVYQADDVGRWLGFLAYHLTNQPLRHHPDHHGTRDFAWSELAGRTLKPRTARLTVGLTLGLTVWLAGLVVWLAAGLTAFASGLLTGLTGALLVGFADGFVGALAGGGVGLVKAPSWMRETPGFANLSRRPGSLRLLIQRVLGVGLMSGLAIWLVTDLMVWLVTELSSRFTHGPVFLALLALGAMVGAAGGLGAGLVSGAIHWIEAPTPADHAGTPLVTWRADRSLNLVRTAAGVLVTVLVVGLVGGIIGGNEGGNVIGYPRGIVEAVVFALAFGVVGGLVGGLTLGQHHAWLMYVIATYRLALRRQLPRRLMPFLDDMHRLGLLRAVGSVYQFRHAELHDHLAAAYGSISEEHPGN